MTRWVLTGLAVVVLGLGNAACGGKDGGGKDGGGDGGGGGAGADGGGADVTAGTFENWEAPACGDAGAPNMDQVLAYSGGQLRLCILESETRLWALDGDGKPDAGFRKGQVEVFFTPEGGGEQMISGLLMKGSAGEGYATRMVGNGGKNVSGVRVVIGDEEVRF